MTKTRAIHFSTLRQWGEVLRVPGVTFVNLQYDECRAELAEARELFGVAIHAFDDIDLMNDLDAAAALTSALDLVITPGTSVASMAGVLGVETWQLTPQHLVWETFGTDGIPFAPSVRVVNRAWDESWDRVLAGVAARLRARLAESSA